MSSSGDMLRLFLERIERLDAEIAGLQQDRRDVFSEAKAQGFDVKVMRAQLTRRKMETHDRQEADALLEAYEAAVRGDDAALEAVLTMPAEDAMDIAIRMVAAQVEGITDGPLAVALRAGMTLILEEREDIREIQARINGVHKKNLKALGLDVPRVMDAVRWVEKCEKHGTEKMLTADATYRLYRSTFEAGDQKSVDNARDAVLLAKFAGVQSKSSHTPKTSVSSQLLDARRFSSGGDA